MTTAAEYTRKSQLALGVTLICAIFGLETVFAHHRMPNPASPFVWAVLGGVGGAALAACFWFRAKARRAGP